MLPLTNSEHPALSLIMPCFNEQGSIDLSIRQLVDAFDAAHYRLQLVAVDNGSRDETRAILLRLAAELPSVECVPLDENVGYSHGILAGLAACTAPWAGIVHADGQVDGQDVALLFAAVLASDGRVIGKVRRRFRMDGFDRRIISIAYNLFFRALWPRIQSLDVNGCPKILPRAAFEAMQLESRSWCIDPEILIKGHYMGLEVHEVNVFARKRSRGQSHVTKPVCFEFLRQLIAFRFARRWSSLRTALPFTEPPAGSSVGRGGAT